MGKAKRDVSHIKLHRSIVVILIALMAISAYTFVLQKIYNRNVIENAVEENIRRTDAMHKGVSDILTRADFTGINGREDMSTDRYRNLQGHLNEIRSMNATRYFYTVKRGADGRLIYLVDGLERGADDFAYPGTYIEEEMIPYIERALTGETVYSLDIIDTTWGHIFTACYPVRAKDGTGDILGALCIEMDMEPTYEFVQQHNTAAMETGAVTAVILGILMLCAGSFLQKEQKKNQEQKEQLAKAVRAANAANQAKSTFLFNMSHDIRTPMNAIIGYSNLAEKHLQEPEKLEEYIKNIQTSGKNLLSLLDNILDLAQIENNKTVIENSLSNVKEDFDACITMFRHTAELKNLKLTEEADLLYPYIYVDVPHLSEILINIISNAVKYTGSGGQIHCAIKQNRADESGNSDLIIRIADTGIGMSEEFLTRIFEPFEREHTSTVSHVEGIGLGMGIVKKLIDLMGGEISVSSTIGKGSVFTVTIPCRVASEEDAKPKYADIKMEEIRTKLRGKRILLTEDNDLNADIAIELLTEVGLLVERANDGVACVEMLEKAPEAYYDLILMDIQMPVMNGYDTTQKIRRMHDAGKSSIPIIAMTANAFSEDKQKALQVGMDDHVAKPIDMNVLLPTILKYLK